MSGVGDPALFLESRFGLQVKRVGREEFASACPFCGGSDRFRSFMSGRYWCRSGPGHCGRSGWLDEIDGTDKPSELDLIKWRLAALERQQQETAQRVTLLEQMHRCTNHLRYHAATIEEGEGIDYWFSEGIAWDSIVKHKLGYCQSCPTYPASASYTLPVLFRGKLYQIRHRLANPPVSGGKYRPEVAGLPSLIYNADDLDATDTRQIIIAEGEKKAIVLSAETRIPVIATMGCQSFKPEWAPKLAKFRAVYVCLDPDATEQACQVAALFGGRGRVMNLPMKADDFFVRGNGTPAEFAGYMRDAWKV